MGLNNSLKEKRIFRIEMEPDFRSPTEFTYCYARDLEAAIASGKLYCFMKKKKFFNVVEIYPWEIVTEEND